MDPCGTMEELSKDINECVDCIANGSDGSAMVAMEKVSSIQSAANRALAVHVDSAIQGPSPLHLQWVCTLSPGMCTMIRALCAKGTKAHHPKLYDAVVFLYRYTVDHFIDVLNSLDVATLCSIAEVLLPVCLESGNDFAVTNLCFKALSKLLLWLAELDTMDGNTSTPVVSSFVELICLRLSDAVHECLLAAQDTSEAAERRFGRVGRILRFYLSHLASMMKSYVSVVYMDWDSVLQQWVNLKSCTIAAFLPQKPQAQQEVAGPLSAALDSVITPVATSAIVSTDVKRTWLLRLMDEQRDVNPQCCQERCGAILLLADLLVHVAPALWGQTSDDELLIDTVLPYLIRSVDHTTSAIDGHAVCGIPSYVLCSAAGPDPHASFFQHLRAQICQFIALMPASRHRMLELQLYSGLRCLSTSCMLLMTQVWVYIFSLASEAWKEQQIATLTNLVVHVAKSKAACIRVLTSEEVDVYTHLLRTLQRTLRSLPECEAGVLKVFVANIQTTMQQPNCLLLSAIMLSLPPWAMKQLFEDHLQVWLSAVTKSTNLIQELVSSVPEPDTHLLVPALEVARACLSRAHVLNTESPNAEEGDEDGCAGCFGGRLPPIMPSEDKPGCHCVAIHVGKFTAVSEYLQKLLAAIGNVLLKINVTSHTDYDGDRLYIISLCLEACGTLLPIMKPQVLIKLLSRLATEYNTQPLLAMSIADLLCKFAFQAFSDAVLEPQKQQMFDLLCQLWKHLLQGPTIRPIDWLPLQRSLMCFEAFAKFTSLQYEKMVEGDAKKRVVRYIQNMLDEAEVAMNAEEEKFHSSATNERCRSSAACHAALEGKLKRLREESVADQSVSKALRVSEGASSPSSSPMDLLDTIADQVNTLVGLVQNHSIPPAHSLVDRLAAVRQQLEMLEHHCIGRAFMLA